MSFRFKLLIFSGLVFLSFALFAYRDGRRTILAMQEQSSQGEFQVRQIAESLMREERSLMRWLYKLAQKQKPNSSGTALDFEGEPGFHWFAVFQRQSLGLEAKGFFPSPVNLAPSSKMPAADLVADWKNALLRQKIPSQSLAWGFFENQNRKYLMVALTGEGPLADSVMTALFDRHWLTSFLGRQPTGQGSFAVVGAENDILFSNQSDLIGENAEVLAWFLDSKKKGHPARSEFTNRFGDTFFVHFLQPAGSALQIASMHLSPSALFLSAWRNSFALLVLATFVLALATLIYFLGGAQKTLQFFAIENSFFKKHEEPRTPIFEVPAQALPERPQISAEKQKAKAAEEAALAGSSFDSVMICLGALRSLRAELPKSTQARLQTMESQLRQMKDRFAVHLHNQREGPAVERVKWSELLEDQPSSISNVEDHSNLKGDSKDEFDVVIRRPKNLN